MSSGMVGPEKLDLKWFDFEANAGKTFRKLRDRSEFADVTLVSGDGEQVEAHKVILASSSNFFWNILERSKHPRPLIYMRGINLVDLTSLLDFIYFGETSVQHGNIDAFLSLAKELGLTGVEREAKKEEPEAAFDPWNAGRADGQRWIKPSPETDSQLKSSLLGRKLGTDFDAVGERNQSSNPIESTDGDMVDDKELVEELQEEKTDFSSEESETIDVFEETDADQPIASNCHQALAVKDAVQLIQRRNCGSVSQIPPKPESGTVWRFRTDRC